MGKALTVGVVVIGYDECHGYKSHTHIMYIIHYYKHVTLNYLKPPGIQSVFWVQSIK